MLGHSNMSRLLRKGASEKQLLQHLIRSRIQMAGAERGEARPQRSFMGGGPWNNGEANILNQYNPFSGSMQRSSPAPLLQFSAPGLELQRPLEEEDFQDEEAFQDGRYEIPLQTDTDQGPDKILPGDNALCWDPSGVVTLQVEEEGPASLPPLSVHSLFREAVERAPDTIALKVKRDGGFQTWTYAQYEQDSNACARALINMGLAPGAGVCIMGHNAPEWFISNFGAIIAGGLSVGMNPSSSREQCLHMARDSKAGIIVVDTADDARKILDIKDQLEHLKVVVQWGPSLVPGAVSWDDFLSLGYTESDEALQERIQDQAVNKCCTLIYTSGTTGAPKGVMCSQDSLTYCARSIAHLFSFQPSQEVMVSYLPLNHIAGQITDLYITLSTNATVHFAEKDAIQGNFTSTLQEVSPTGFLVIPRILEKIQQGITSGISKKSFLMQHIFYWAQSEVLTYHNIKLQGETPGYSTTYKYQFAKFLMMDKIKQKIGFANMTNIVVGSAPVSAEMMDFFLSIDAPLTNAYGMSETQSLGAMGHFHSSMYRRGSVGKPLEYAGMKILDADERGEGEICFKGRNVFMGYLNSEEKTQETFAEDRWMKSGDLGYIDEDGYLFVSGRSKELIITAGGEKVAPLIVEQEVKKELPVLSNLVLVGDKLKFVSMLMTLQCDTDPKTQAVLDTLPCHVTAWLESHGCLLTSAKEVAEMVRQDPTCAVAQAIDAGLERANERADTNVHKVKKWTLLPRDFSVATGEFNATYKLVRSTVLEKYQEEIQAMYRGGKQYECDK